MLIEIERLILNFNSNGTLLSAIVRQEMDEGRMEIN